MRIILWLLVLTALGLGVFWAATRPSPLPADAMAGISGDPLRGEQVFHATGCASCHMAPGATGEAQLVLAGGQRFASPFGSFIAPNISQDATHGIGGWSMLDLANAMQRGIDPEGRHLYPVFPYPAYTRMERQDIADLHAYLVTLPADASPNGPHDLAFPFSIRRLVGGWNLLFLDDAPVLNADLTPEETRGRYLVEAMAHCAECHTPRGALGNLDKARWLGGAPDFADANGRAQVPNITPGALDWSQDELVEYFTSGFTPDYDSAGGHMALVVENLARLPETDRRAIAAYLAKVPPVPPAAN